ncbi:hypothetical protein AB0395_44835 [Streptosporangium sp. NPDC051023]|uniref:hypothetical protein n=1 Tax=Streptosporangium sp. NPDC051023 TaxID=3155410 RepID=UPI00344D37E7
MTAGDLKGLSTPEALDRLKAQHPGWFIWRTGDLSAWFACPRDDPARKPDLRSGVSAYCPDVLSHRIAEQDSPNRKATP